MLNLFLKVMIKKCVAILRSLGGRKKKILILPLLLYLLILVTTCWWLVEMVTKALLPPPPPDQNLEHFRRNRSLAHYMDHISVLIEPSSVPCSDLDEVPLLILVTSAPSRFHHRQAVRNTWGSYQPTYFILGQDAHDSEGMLGDNYMEAKEHRDMVVYDFLDHYQNLTLKTALMIQWTIDRCPQAKFLLKTDDDVLVNPWAMEQVLKENREAQLLGYKLTAYLHRDEYAKWYIPRWIYPEDVVPDYLSGSGYLIAGEYLTSIMATSYQIPLVNLEDIYFTYLVAKALRLSLSHDSRLNPYRPWLPTGCSYWSLALSHSFKPEEMVATWDKIKYIGNFNDKQFCT